MLPLQTLPWKGFVTNFFSGEGHSIARILFINPSTPLTATLPHVSEIHPHSAVASSSPRSIAFANNAPISSCCFYQFLQRVFNSSTYSCNNL